MAGQPRCKRLLLALSPASNPGEATAAAEKLGSLGYLVETVTLESYEPREVARLTSRCPPGECCIVVPGGVRYDYSSLEGVRVVKGTYTLRALPLVLEVFGPDALSPSLPAEKALGARMWRVASRLSCRLSREAPLTPVRPPPLRVASEVYVDAFPSIGDALEEAEARFEMGADIVVLATREASQASSHMLVEALEGALRRGLGPLGVDPADRSLLPRLAGKADLLMSLWSSEAVSASWLRGSTVVVLEPGGGRALVEACRRLRKAGVNAVMDPVAEPHPRALRAFTALREARGMGLDCPALLGINNVYEMIDADTTGSIAVLALLAAEAGASAVLVSEESGKASGATAEARIAAVMADYSLYTGAPPKDLGASLLAAKCKSYRPPHGRGKLEAARRGERCLESLREALEAAPCREATL